MRSSDPRPEVVYVRPDGTYRTLMVSSFTGDERAVFVTARQENARFFIKQEHHDKSDPEPQFCVYDMRTAQKDTPTPGEWSINPAIRMFRRDQLDAAIMWAAMKAIA